MYSASVVRQLSSTTSPQLPRSLGRGAQTLARGPGWQLAEGEGVSWTLRLDCSAQDPLAIWSDMLDAVRNIAETHELRPLLVDLRGCPRLSGLTAELAAQLFDEFERRSRRIGVVVGPDLVHAARLHRLLDFHAPTLGRCFLNEDEALDWVVRGTWPIAPPSPVVARPWTRSRPYLSTTTKDPRSQP